MLPFCILNLKVLLSDLYKKAVLLAFIFKGRVVSGNDSLSACTFTQLSVSMSFGTRGIYFYFLSAHNNCEICSWLLSLLFRKDYIRPLPYIHIPIFCYLYKSNLCSFHTFTSCSTR